MPPISDATPRIRRRRRRSFGRVGLSSAVVVGLVAAGVWLVGFSTVLAVSQVRVAGASVLSDDEVRQVAAVELGTPLSRVDTGQIEERVAALPPVREVSVHRSWPDTITITIAERNPIFAVKQNQGDGHLLVDADGVAYTEVGRVPDGLLVDIATVVGDLSPEIRELVTGVSAETRDSIQLDLTKGRTVVWGSAERGPLKASVLEVLLEQKGTVYNVSAPEQPAIR